MFLYLLLTLKHGLFLFFPREELISQLRCNAWNLRSIPKLSISLWTHLLSSVLSSFSPSLTCEISVCDMWAKDETCVLDGLQRQAGVTEHNLSDLVPARLSGTETTRHLQLKKSVCVCVGIMGCIVSHQKVCWNLNHWYLWMWLYFGKRVFGHAFNLRWGHLGNLKSKDDWCSHKKRKRHKRRISCDDRGRE